MGQKTRFSAAVLGAILMFFVGGNIPLIAGLLGLTRGRFSKHSSSGGALGSSPTPRPVRLSKRQVSVNALAAVLADDERALCGKRYPHGFDWTEEQDEWLTGQRYFIVITLRNNEDMLHHALYELLGVIARLGPKNVFVSVFENNSKDKTPQFLALFTDLLKLVGVAHNLVSTFTLHRELAALRKAGGAADAVPAAGRRLLENVERAWFEQRVRESLDAQLVENATLDATEWWPPVEDGDDARRSGRGSAGNGAPARADERWGALLAQARGIAAGWRAAFAHAGEDAHASGVGLARGRALADDGKADTVAEDIALLVDGKWTGNRIEFLARVRNRSIRPLFSRKERYDRVIIMNDAYWCAEDVIRLALHKDADVACGMDFDTTPHYNVGFYDTWVTRDITGEPFKKSEPFVQRAEEAQLLRLGYPFPVYCCWNGLLVANARPFYEGVRFRRGVDGECAASECQLFCKDFWRKRARNFVLDPHVRVAYDLETYENLHTPQWLDSTRKGANNKSRIDWPESIAFPARPTELVYCCGLVGNGRDPDAPCYHEGTLLEP